MNILDIVLIGVALAMDACALTIANCATYSKSLDRKKEISMPVTFAIFQFLMPVIGYFIGSLFSEYLATVSKFITAGIFFVLGLKIVVDNVIEIVKEKRAVNTPQEKGEDKKAEFTVWVLLLQALATSIDALAIGVTFAVGLTINIFVAAAIIGGVTILIATIALLFGKYLGKLFGKYAEWLGAIILISLAIKNLVEAFA